METRLRVGAWRTCITPPVPGYLAGHFREVRYEGIMDDLFANALVLDDGTIRVALISLDLCFVPGSLVPAIRAAVEEVSGIPASNVLLTATHTHTGPVLNWTTGTMGAADPAYVRALPRLIASSVAMAARRAVAAKAGSGRSESARFTFNRRLRRPSDGQILMNWIEHDMVHGLRASGPTDPEMLVLRFDDLAGAPLAVVVNYALHNNAVMEPLISADLSGAMASVLRRVLGDAPVLFLPGACGDVNWVDHEDTGRVGRTDLFLRVGMSLAGAALEALGGITTGPVDSLGIAHASPRVRERPWGDYDRKEDDTFGNGPLRKSFYDGYRNDRDAHAGAPLAEHELELCALRIGRDVALATTPNEVFCELGMRLKQGSPFRHTLFAELTNGSMGYVPTRQAFAEGGYEVRKVTGGSFLDVGAGDMIVAEGLSLLNALRVE